MLILCVVVGRGSRFPQPSHSGTRITSEVSAPRRNCLIANKKGQKKQYVSQKGKPRGTSSTELRLITVYPFPLGKKVSFPEGSELLWKLSKLRAE